MNAESILHSPLTITLLRPSAWTLELGLMSLLIGAAEIWGTC